MNRRPTALALGVVLVLAIAVGALLAYPLSEKEHRPAERAFAVGDADGYRIAANVTVDGETVLAVDGAVAESGERRVRIVEDGVVVERYQEGEEDSVYVRHVIEENADRRLRELEEDPDRTVIDEEWENDTLTAVTVTEAPDTVLDPTGAASVVTTELRVAAYEDVDATDGGELHVIEPQNGWYDGSRSYRITGSAGEVRIDPATDVLHSAEVRWNLTPNTLTYAHYLANRKHTITQEIAYDYDTGDVSVDAPEWVDGTAERSFASSNDD